jgi:type III restriction enzyme
MSIVHAQMQTHQWESAVDSEVKISKGFSTLKQSAFTAAADGVRHFRPPVDEKSKIGQMVFGGFQRCLYPVQKFDSDTERRFSVILEKESDTFLAPRKTEKLLITNKVTTNFSASLCTPVS